MKKSQNRVGSASNSDDEEMSRKHKKKKWMLSDEEEHEEDLAIHKKTKKLKKKVTDIGEDIDPKYNNEKKRTPKTSSIDKYDLETHDLSEMDMSTLKPQQTKKYGGKGRNLKLRENDPYPGDAPIPEERIKKYERGEKINLTGIRTKFHSKQLKRREANYKKASVTAARAELLLTEQAGFIEADEGEYTSDFTQHEIARCVDITSAQKFFELKLDKFGPYRMNYTRNGRFLLLGGGKGHIATIDWQSKKLMCEMNVMETCHDVKWLHIETMFAVAQRQWTYIYDNQGIELHCLKALDNVLRMEFLPYHFLLAAANSKGYLQWLDVSVGQKVAGYVTGHGRLDVMCQNPANAIIHLGHPGGTVTMWSPNIKEPLVKMLCHGGATRAVTVSSDGLYMATSGVDRTLKLWDLRTFKLLHGYRVSAGAGNLAFSQRGLLATGLGNVVEIYKDPCHEAQSSVYLTHSVPATTQSLQFCPYEDVLGIGHQRGFTSILVPGSGEPNFDALEANPFQSKRQRQHAEVKMLLEKIQPEMISMDTSALAKIDRKDLQEAMEEKAKKLFLKPEKFDFDPKHKMKGKSKAGRLERRKKGVIEDHKRHQIRNQARERKLQAQAAEAEEEEDEEEEHERETQRRGPYNALGRFTKKTKVSHVDGKDD